MYKQLNDDEILYMIKENDDNYKIIIDKYYPLIRKICGEFLVSAKNYGYELDDLIQVANIGILNAVRSYQDNKNASFYTYLIHCVKNTLKKEIKAEKTLKRCSLNYSISYNELLPRENHTLLDIIPNKKALDPYLECLQTYEEIEYTNFLNSLPLEIAVAYEMKMNGFANSEISLFLDVDKLSVMRFLKTARLELAKWSKLLD